MTNSLLFDSLIHCNNRFRVSVQRLTSENDKTCMPNLIHSFIDFVTMRSGFNQL